MPNIKLQYSMVINLEQLQNREIELQFRLNVQIIAQWILHLNSFDNHEKKSE